MANKISAWREELGFTQQELALRSSVNLRQIQLIEYERSLIGCMPLYSSMALTRALEMEIQEII